MDWVCAAGCTLFMPSGSADHLYVILNCPKDFLGLPPQSCILVNFSTVRNAPYDPTCIVQSGSHSFINSTSYIYYRHARIETAMHLSSMVANNYFNPHQPVNEGLLSSIIAGLYASKFTPNFIKTLEI